MIRVRRITIIAIGMAGFVLGAFGGWVQGQDSTRCADYQGARVCISTSNGGQNTHAFDPRTEETP